MTTQRYWHLSAAFIESLVQNPHFALESFVALNNKHAQRLHQKVGF